MGTGAEFALAAIAVAGAAGKMVGAVSAEKADLSAINQQSKLLALNYQEKNLHNLDMTEKILNRQQAQLSTRGVAYDSPSFNAIQRETLNIGARNEGRLKTEETLAKKGLDIERRNVKNTLYAELFGAAGSIGFGGLDLYDKTPKKLPQSEDL